MLNIALPSLLAVLHVLLPSVHQPAATLDCSDVLQQPHGKIAPRFVRGSLTSPHQGISRGAAQCLLPAQILPSAVPR